MANISFKIQSSKSPAEISVRVRKGRQIDLLVKIGRTINIEDWDATKGLPIHIRNTQLKLIYQAIQEIKARIIENLDEDLSNGMNIDSEWLRQQINPDTKKNIPLKLVEHFDFYLEFKKNSISKNTKKKINSFKNLVIKFENWAKKSYQINEVDLSFQERLNSFAKNPLYNYHKNYMVDLLKFIKTLCENASKNGVKVNPQTRLLEAKKTKNPIIYLNNIDIEKIKNVELKTEYLDNVRDWLLISCETGQRVSDFMLFTKSMIHERKTKDGNIAKLIEFMQEKTEIEMSVVITPLVLDILNKRNGDFPRRISQQRYNEYTKIVCEIAEVNDVIYGAKQNSIKKRREFGYFEKYKLVSSHIGRRSFASNYYSKFPTPMLMRQTGHTSERTFLIYIGKSNMDLSLDFYDAIYKQP
jgi:integrase